MKVTVAALAAIFGLAVASPSLYENEDASVLAKWFEYRHIHGRLYESENEESIRFNNFKSTLSRIEEKNKNGNTNIFGVTKFADLTPREFKAMYLNYKPSGEKRDYPVMNPNLRMTTPTSFDWRDEGMVTPVKDQGQCGSCWAHGAVENVESAWAIAGNPLTEFSVQQVVSCDSNDAGCNGGDLPTAYDYIESAGGLATAASYPYTSSKGNSGKCNSFTVAGADVNGYGYGTDPCYAFCNNQDESTLQQNLYSNQPFGICVDAEPWQDYVSGVMTNANADCAYGYFNLDHCVQLVGYNAGGSTPYWIVRNSWNTDWGVEGYIYLAMGDNTCGLADEAMGVTFA